MSKLFVKYEEPGIEVTVDFEVAYTLPNPTFSNIRMKWTGDAGLMSHPELKRMGNDWQFIQSYPDYQQGKPEYVHTPINSALATEVIALMLEKVRKTRPY